MRVAELEDWLAKMGWELQPMKGGSHRHWTHPLFPRQRLTYSTQHGRVFPPQIVVNIYQDLIAMQPAAAEALSA